MSTSLNAVINLDLLQSEEPIVNAGIFTITDIKHPLSQSTVIDNCGAVHLVNSVSLLEEGSFKRTFGNESVDAGSSTLPVLGYGTRRFNNALNGENRERTEDLILSEVAVVEGFRLNIVSEARLRKAGLWYCGFDCTIRFGQPDQSVVVAKL